MKYVILSLVLIIVGCKNANDEMKNVATENATALTVEEDFDKVAFYEDYIQENFEEHVEKLKIAQKHPELPHEEVDSFFSLSYGRLKLRRIELNFIEDSLDWTPSSSFKIDPEYPYNYKFTKVLWDSSLQKEIKFEEIISIEENHQVIDGDSIPTVKIIWNHHSS